MFGDPTEPQNPLAAESAFMLRRQSQGCGLGSVLLRRVGVSALF